MSESIIWDIIIPSTLSENPPNPLAYLTSLYSPSFSSTTKSKSSRKPTTPKSKSPKETKPAPGLLKLRNQKPKYQITDISGLLAERTNVTLSVGWNIQPWVGALLWNGYPTPKNWKALSGGRSEAFSFPPIKGKKKEETVVGKGEVPRAGGAEPVVGGRG